MKSALLICVKISNWAKITALKANKPIADKTLRAGRKIRVLQNKPMAWQMSSRDVRVALCSKDTVSHFKEGILEGGIRVINC